MARSSARKDWETPLWFFERLNKAAGGFLVDAAASAGNRLCEMWYGPGSLFPDALKVEVWESPAFCNPPYESGKQWLKWLIKFREQAELGNTVVVIMPAATGTEWWAEHVVAANADVLFCTGRLPFTLPDRAAKSQPNHDSAVVVYSPESARRIGWIRVREELTSAVHNNEPSDVPAVQGPAVEQTSVQLQLGSGDAPTKATVQDPDPHAGQPGAGQPGLGVL